MPQAKTLPLRFTKDKPHTFRAVRIRWLDSSSIAGWESLTSLTRGRVEPSPIETVGWVFYEDDEFVLLSTSISDQRSIMDPLTIPKCAILRRKWLSSKVKVR